MEEPTIEYDQGFNDGIKEGKRQLQKRIKELENLLKNFADSPQCMHVPNWVVLKCEQALKGGK